MIDYPVIDLKFGIGEVVQLGTTFNVKNELWQLTKIEIVKIGLADDNMVIAITGRASRLK